MHGSALSLEHRCCSRCTDLVDAVLDLHLLQKGLVVCVVAACLALFSELGATHPEVQQQHETPATVCWIATMKIKTSFSHAVCIRTRVVKIADGIKPPWPWSDLWEFSFPLDNSLQSRSKRQVPAGLNRSNIVANLRPSRRCRWLTRCRLPDTPLGFQYHRRADSKGLGLASSIAERSAEQGRFGWKCK